MWSVTQSEQDGIEDGKAPLLQQIVFPGEGVRLEIQKLIIEWDGETPTSAMCSICPGDLSYAAVA